MKPPLQIIDGATGRSYLIAADPSSRVGKKLLQGIPYEQPLLTYIRDQGYHGAAVDAGAHIGNHALYLAAVCKLEVFAFEPIFHAELRDNVALNGEAFPVRVYDYALGAIDGWARAAAQQRAPSAGWGSRRIELSPGRGALEVVSVGGVYPMRTLDGCELERVALMKIDVEGMELDVLAGATDTLERCRPDLYIESRDAETHESLAKFLVPLRYSYVLTARTATPVELWRPR